MQTSEEDEDLLSNMQSTRTCSNSEFELPYKVGKITLIQNLNNNFSKKLVNFARSKIEQGLEQMDTLNHVAGFIRDQIAEKEGGNWLCYIIPDKFTNGSIAYTSLGKCIWMSF